MVGRAPGRRRDGANRNERVWIVVSMIPAGCVATYGQVANLAGCPGPTGARQVGYALAALPPGSSIPWHRVVNVRGRISARGDGGAPDRQRDLLGAEGVDFDLHGAIDLARHLWRP